MRTTLFFLLSIFGSLNLACQNWNQVDSIIKSNLAAYNSNTVIMVGQNGKLVHYKTFGTFDSLTTRPIASLTKSYSGLLLLKLAQSGNIDLNDSIGKFLPNATLNGKGNSTLKQNFAHTAGWNGSKGDKFLSDNSITLQQSADSIIKYDTWEYEPGTKFKYTGVSMQVAGAAIEAKMNTPWNKLWEDSIQKPLGLSKTVFLNKTNPRVAGGLMSCPRDIYQLAKLIANNGLMDNGRTLLDSVFMQQLWVDQTNMVPVIAMPYPYSPAYNNPYNADTIRYSLGCWQDIYNSNTNYLEQISGGGAFGSIFWVNRCHNTFGVIFTKSNFNTTWQSSFQAIDAINSFYENQCVTNSAKEVLESAANYSLYPNPATTHIAIETNQKLSTSSQVEIRIINTQGKTIFTQNHFDQISLENFTKGLYFVSIKNGNEFSTLKFSKF